ncbi:MAG TPA: very short patch repair endonuclease [Methylocella sp.]|nr:very short patch repair endonuclease [Methylocella sp.]
MDHVDSKTRSRIMSSVGQKNTGPEMTLRSALHRAGLRYVLHDRGLPGSPDLVFARRRAVIFVHGCYWHAHGCHRSTIPLTRREFWLSKFTANKRRDAENDAKLTAAGWRVLRVWECALVGKSARSGDQIAKDVIRWLYSDSLIQDIPEIDSAEPGSC